MNRNLLIFATKLEAKPWLIGPSETLWQTQACQMMRLAHYDILICGIGPVLSAWSCGKINTPYQQWINLGIAGALNPSLNLADICEVGNVFFHGQKHPFDHEHDLIQINEAKTLCTVHAALHDKTLKTQLSQKADLVDMEGYSIALAAKLQQTPLRMLKIISDYSQEDDAKDIPKRIPMLMNQLKEFLSDS